MSKEVKKSTNPFAKPQEGKLPTAPDKLSQAMLDREADLKDQAAADAEQDKAPEAMFGALGKKPKGKAVQAGIEVHATAPGFFHQSRKEVGDIFFIKDDSEFSDKWMEKVQK